MLDYEAEIRKAWKKNFDSDDLTDVSAFCEHTGYSRDNVERKIREDAMFKWCFVKPPVKQRIHEKIAAKFIGRLPGITDFHNHGPTDLYLVEGDVIPKNRLGSRESKCTGIDFSWKYNGTMFYASHKYTKESGGGQGTQYKDLQCFISEALKVADDRAFVAIADGGWYDSLDTHAGKTRMSHLKSLAGTDQVWATCINDLEQLLRDRF